MNCCTLVRETCIAQRAVERSQNSTVSSINVMADITILKSAAGVRMKCPACGKILPVRDHTDCGGCGAEIALTAEVT